MNDDVRISSDWRSEMGVDWHIEGIMNPCLFLCRFNYKVLGLLKKEDQLIIEDVFDTLFDFWVFRNFIEFLLNFDVLGYFNGMTNFFSEFLKFLYFLFAWELMLSE